MEIDCFSAIMRVRYPYLSIKWSQVAGITAYLIYYFSFKSLPRFLSVTRGTGRKLEDSMTDIFILSIRKCHIMKLLIVLGR
jgi:hypothetical protein